MSEQANVSLIMSLYDAFRRGDIATILTHLDPEAELSVEGPSAIPWAGNRRGSESWEKYFQAVSDSADEITVTMQPFAAQGDNVVAAGRVQARIKLTGKRIDTPLVHLWSLRDGRVVRCQELVDTAATLAAFTAGAAAGR